MDNARYAPPLSEWPEWVEWAAPERPRYLDAKPLNPDGWVSRQQRAKYEAELRADAEFLRTTALMMEGSTEFLTPQHHRHFDRLRRIADRLEGKA